jgi:hypothetical protein
VVSLEAPQPHSAARKKGMNNALHVADISELYTFGRDFSERKGCPEIALQPIVMYFVPAQ